MKSRRNGKVELLRFLFCLIIVVMHSKTFAPDQGNLYFYRGALGVEFFFFLSGYLMMNSISRMKKPAAEGSLGGETRDFIFHKIGALMPNYVVAWLIGFLVYFTARDHLSITAGAKRLADTLWEVNFLQMAGFGESRINGIDWYISAMLLAMFMLYPLARKYSDMFMNVIAPLTGIFILGYMYWKTGTPTGVRTDMGIAYKGMFRALADVSLGAAAFPLVKKIKETSFTLAGRTVLSFTELAVYIAVFAFMMFADSGKYDFVCVFLIWSGLALSMGHQGLVADIFDNSFSMWLGRFSLSLYLSHLYWGRILGNLQKAKDAKGITAAIKGLSYSQTLVVYLGMTLVTALFVYYFSLFLKYLNQHLKPMNAFVEPTSKGE